MADRQRATPPSSVRRALIGAAAAQGWLALGARAQTSPGAEAESMQQRLDRWRAAAAAAQAAETPERRAQRLRERREWLDRGEAALARGDDAVALAAFERAAQMEHAADTEMSLVRAYMQAGDYRRAVSFGAHTAGAHRQVVAGAVLYSWLLSQGGQDAIAQQLLDTAARTAASNEAPDPLLDEARRLMATPAAVPRGALMAAPVRLAPYARGAATPGGARVVGSGVLVGDGRLALVPESLLRGARSVCLRNGLGQTVRAQRDAERSAPVRSAGLAVLRLQAALPTVPLPAAAERDPFPGSPGSLVGYSPSADDQPAWPRLQVGFHGMPDEHGGLRQLGIGPVSNAGPGLGGPIFDAAGRWVGIAVPHPDGRPRAALAVSVLRPALGDALLQPSSGAPREAAAPGARMPIDEVYEQSLRVALQVIARA